MFRFVTISGTAIALMSMLSSANAADYSAEAAATKAYYEKAMPVYSQLGPEAALKDFNTPKKWFVDQYGLHITVTLNDSTLVADSGFPELVGMKWNEVDDLDGKALGPAVLRKRRSIFESRRGFLRDSLDGLYFVDGGGDRHCRHQAPLRGRQSCSG